MSRAQALRPIALALSLALATPLCAAPPEVQQLDQQLAVEIVRGIAAGRLDGLEAFAVSLDADRPPDRQAFLPAWVLIRNTLKDAGLRARVGARADRLRWLEWRIEAAFAEGQRKGKRSDAGGWGMMLFGAVVAPPAAIPTIVAPPGNAVTSSVPLLVVADFRERGRATGGGVAAADLLARALADSRRFRVVRGAAGIGQPGFLVQGDLSPIRVYGAPGPYSYPYPVRHHRHHVPQPYVYPNDLRYAVDVRVRVSDLLTGATLGERTASGWITAPVPHRPGGPGGVVVEQALLDRKTGAARTVLDLLPVRGAVLLQEPARTAIVQVPDATALAAGERFVVLGPAGEERAVLRVVEAVSATLVRARVSGPDEREFLGALLPGEPVVSRGY